MSELDLYIFRHGIAQERGSRYPDDSKRPLTAEGKKEVKTVAKAMKNLGLRFDSVLSSDYKRAVQTSEIVAESLRLKKKLQYLPSLRPEAEPRKVLADIKTGRSSKSRSILAVGHEPHLSSLISLLIFQRPMKGIRLKKAGLAKLTLVPGSRPKARLSWLLTPRQLALMASH